MMFSIIYLNSKKVGAMQYAKYLIEKFMNVDDDEIKDYLTVMILHYANFMFKYFKVTPEELITNKKMKEKLNDKLLFFLLQIKNID